MNLTTLADGRVHLECIYGFAFKFAAAQDTSALFGLIAGKQRVQTSRRNVLSPQTAV